MNNEDYHINIFYSDADKGYIADIPLISTPVRHLAKHRRSAQQAQLAKNWLETARAEGNHSRPRYRPVIYQTGS